MYVQSVRGEGLGCWKDRAGQWCGSTQGGRRNDLWGVVGGEEAEEEEELGKVGVGLVSGF